jgi:hypothetical protein
MFRLMEPSSGIVVLEELIRKIIYSINTRQPVWSSGQSFWLRDPEVPRSITGPTRFSEK